MIIIRPEMARFTGFLCSAILKNRRPTRRTDRSATLSGNWRPVSAHRLGELMLLRLDLQSDGSPHFLRVLQERPMYDSTSSPRTSRSPCEEYRLQGADLPRLGHPQVHEIP